MPARNVVQIIINADDNASEVLGNVVGGIQNIGEAALSIVGAGLTAASVAVTGFAVSSLMAFGDFQSGINEVFTLLPGITEDAMRQMEGDVQQFMNVTGRLSEEAIPALYQALSAGVPPDNVFDFLEIANKAAMGGVATLETAVNGISSAVNAYGAEILDAGTASDLMFTAVRLGKTTFGELSDSMFQVTTIAAGMGVAFGDVLAGVATLTSQGVPTSVAMTQIRQAMLEMNDAGTVVGEKFTELAGVGMADFIAQGNTLADAFALLAEEAERTGVPIEQMFGSVEAGQAALALTGANMDTFTNNINEMGDSAGATDAAFNTMTKGIGYALQLLGGRWQSLLVGMGRIIEPFVTPIVDAFSTIIAYLAATIETGDPLNDWLANLPQWLRPAVALLGDFAMWLLTTAEAFGSMSAAIAAGVDPLTAFQHFLYEIAGADVANAFGDITLAVQGFLAAAQEVLQPVLDWLAANVEIQDVLVALGIAISSVVIPAIAALFAAFAPVAALIGTVVLLRNAWEENWMGMRDILTNAWETGIRPALEGIGTFLTGLWTAFQEGGLSGAGTFIQEKIVTPLLEQIAAIDWGVVANAVLSFMGNAFLTQVGWFVWVYDNLLIPLKDNAIAAVESVDWFMVGANIIFAIGNALTTAFDFMTWIVDSLFNPIVANTDAATGQVDWTAVGDAVMGAIASALLGFFQFGLWLVNTIFRPLIAGASSAIASVDWGSIGTGLMEAIGNALPDVNAWTMANIITPITNALSSFDPFAFMNGGQGATISISPSYNSGDITGGGSFGGSSGRIGGRQFGGSVSAGIPTWVGESGKEIFVPNTDGEIMNNRDSEMASGGGKSIQIVMNFHRGITDSEATDAAYKLSRELKAQGFQVEG